MNLVIIIPAFNEEKTIARVVRAIPRKIKGIRQIIILVIDDGSDDSTEVFAHKSGAQVIRHNINQGVGAATITGLEAAKILGADVVVTMDSDGQHDASEIPKLVTPVIQKKCDVTIGTRTFSRKTMPFLKIFGNLVMNWLTFAIYNLWINDSQSGYKAISANALSKMRLVSSGYEVCSEIIGEIKRLKLRYQEIPVKTIYTPYSKKRGQFALNGINIIIKLIVRAIIG